MNAKPFVLSPEPVRSDDEGKHERLVLAIPPDSEPVSMPRGFASRSC